MTPGQTRLLFKVLLFLMRASIERNRLTPERSHARYEHYEKLVRLVKAEINGPER